MNGKKFYWPFPPKNAIEEKKGGLKAADNIKARILLLPFLQLPPESAFMTYRKFYWQ